MAGSSLLRDKILAAPDIRTERVSVPDWGVEFDVRGMTGTERARVIAASTVHEEDDNGKAVTRQDQAILYPLLLIATVIDPSTGEPVFGPNDRDALNEKSAGVLEQVGLVACRLSGITQDEVKAIRKNSNGTPSGVSSSV